LLHHWCDAPQRGGDKLWMLCVADWQTSGHLGSCAPACTQPPLIQTDNLTSNILLFANLLAPFHWKLGLSRQLQAKCFQCLSWFWLPAGANLVGSRRKLAMAMYGIGQEGSSDEDTGWRMTPSPGSIRSFTTPAKRQQLSLAHLGDSAETDRSRGSGVSDPTQSPGITALDQTVQPGATVLIGTPMLLFSCQQLKAAHAMSIPTVHGEVLHRTTIRLVGPQACHSSMRAAYRHRSLRQPLCQRHRPRTLQQKPRQWQRPCQSRC